MKERLETLAIFVLLALLAAAWQGCGLPDSWPADEVTWIVASMVRRGSFHPGYFLYPSFMVDVCYAVARVLGTHDPVALGHVTRSVSAVFFLLAVLSMGKTVEVVLGKKWPFAYFFCGTIGALLHHGHIGTVNSCFFFTIHLALLQFVRTLRSGREGDFYLSVLACSLAVGAKYNGCFLFALLPLLWLLAFGDLRSKRFLRALLVSLAIAPLPFLATTPYCLLDAAAFGRDWHALTAVEGPAFQTAASVPLPRLFVERFAGSNLGFFSPVVAVLIPLWGLAFYGSCLARPRELLREKPLFSRSVLLLGAGFFVYMGMTWQIGIFQTRYYLPGSLMLALLFLLALDATSKRRLRAATIALALVFNSANAWAHVVAFPCSAKGRALSVLEGLDGTIGVIALPGRFPFQPGVIDERCCVFMTEEPIYDVATFDDYLGIIGGFFAARKPRFVVFEEVVTTWSVFRPKKDAADYGRRLDYKNPGFAAWNAQLEHAGYEKRFVLENDLAPPWLWWLIGSRGLAAAEGIGRPVYIYERRSG
jgi:4-amino-4-deoxy-L-arabinose transferase-like glycosyltransferase